MFSPGENTFSFTFYIFMVQHILAWHFLHPPQFVYSYLMWFIHVCLFNRENVTSIGQQRTAKSTATWWSRWKALRFMPAILFATSFCATLKSKRWEWEGEVGLPGTVRMKWADPVLWKSPFRFYICYHYNKGWKKPKSRQLYQNPCSLKSTSTVITN